VTSKGIVPIQYWDSCLMLSYVCDEPDSASIVESLLGSPARAGIDLQARMMALLVALAEFEAGRKG